jgi:N-formylglutamate amidohydrolase
MTVMTAWEPIAPASAPDAGGLPADEALPTFAITRPVEGVARGPLVFASPHSGRVYPPQMMAASRLDAAAIRRSEDGWVDRLIEDAPDHGVSVIAASVARVFLDVNRDAWELDPAMFSEELPPYARGRSARVAAGFGAIARIVGEGQEIYARKLTFAEARDRVETVHRPYHEALRGLVDETLMDHGVAILMDWHSMPSAAARPSDSAPGCDVVLGDRFGGACSPAVSRRVETELTAMGYAVARNAPYAGGYTTEHYGRPGRRVHALQIEVNRALYMNEATLEPSEGFTRLKSDLNGLFSILAAADWTRI